MRRTRLQAWSSARRSEKGQARMIDGTYVQTTICGGCRGMGGVPIFQSNSADEWTAVPEATRTGHDI